MKRIFFLLVFSLLQIYTYAQNETWPVSDPVYDYLKELSIRGKIENYNDIVIPFSRKKITAYLNEALQHRSELNTTDIEIIGRYLQKLNPPVNVNSKFFYSEDGFWGDKPSYFFLHNDSSYTIQINPLFSLKSIYSGQTKSIANLATAGGKINGSYGNLGFSMLASNGTIFGDRQTALFENGVKYSFTFNNFHLNFFDNTEGYIRYENNILSAELGRERVLWGAGVNRLTLSSNPPVFNFIKFSADFRFINFNFLHGWLVQPVEQFFDPGTNLWLKKSNPKYVAASRIGFVPRSNFSFGFTQTIIYSNRPIEAAYLNPFIFFESAQRAMNDYDNSFLGLDIEYRILNGLELRSEMIFDDINFKTVFSEGLGSMQTRYSWETNINLTHPYMPENTLLTLGWVILRPFMYTHYGQGESLTYTNNSFPLGADLQPNSLKLFLNSVIFFSSKVNAGLNYSHTFHGKNIYDENGNLLQNKGGYYLDFAHLEDPFITHLLAGIKENFDDFGINMNYEFAYNLNFNINYRYISNPNIKQHIIQGELIFSIK